MPITPRTVKPASSAAANWGTGVGQSGQKWADGYANPSRNPFDPSVINPDAWQAGVSDPVAKTRYAHKLAAVDQNQVLITVQGAGKSKYTQAGTTRQPNYLKFSTKFQPFMANVVASLPKKGVRGTNRGRATALWDALEAARGTFN